MFGSSQTGSRFGSSACLWLLVVLVVLAAFSGVAKAARKALVIGNDNYQSVEKLRNAGADADAMAVALKKAGYTVTLRKDRSFRQMKDVIRAFRAAVSGGDEVVFFFSGHGVQIGGRNFLLPIDVRAQVEDQVRDDSIALSDLLLDIASQKPALTLAIVDACRDNPFPGRGRAIGGRGLTAPAGATGQMVIYSAGEGQRALDRLGADDQVKNGVFTRVFIREMERRGVTLREVVNNVRDEVHRLARDHGRGHEQVPAIYDQSLGRFYFYPPSSSIVASAQSPAATDPAALDLAFWNAIKRSTDAREFGAYLEQYPDGRFAALARIRQQQFQPQSQSSPLRAGAESSPGGQKQPATSVRASSAFRDCAACPEMIVIPAGAFMMGSPDTETGRYEDEGPQRRVTVKRFAAGRSEVTFAEWEACVDAGGCGNHRPNDEGWGRGSRPVINVSWNDAKQYAQWISQKSGKPYRLLTEAEWEYAARAGSATRHSYGNKASHLEHHGWYGVNSGGRTQRVAAKRANPFGLYDMHGNVWEWVEDCWHSRYDGAPSEGEAWETGNCTRRVVRGGSWYGAVRDLRSATRFKYTAITRASDLGFRLGASLP